MYNKKTIDEHKDVCIVSRGNDSAAGIDCTNAGISYVVLDQLGSLYKQYGDCFASMGYDVRCLNLLNIVDLKKGSHYNPFRYINDDNSIEALAKALVCSTDLADKQARNPLWEKAETCLLAALIAYARGYSNEEPKSFSSVRRLMNNADISFRQENDATDKRDTLKDIRFAIQKDGLDNYRQEMNTILAEKLIAGRENGESPYTLSPFDDIFEEVAQKDPESFAVKQYRVFKILAGRALPLVYISCANRLKAFAIPEIAALTDSDDISLDTVGNDRVALFVILPVSKENSFKFLASIMYIQLFDRLCPGKGYNVSFASHDDAFATIVPELEEEEHGYSEDEDNFVDDEDYDEDELADDEDVRPARTKTAGIAGMVIAVIAATAVLAVLLMHRSLMASENPIQTVVKLFKVISSITGILSIMTGCFKMVIDNTKDDVYGQQGSAILIAAGLSLLLIKAIMATLSL